MERETATGRNRLKSFPSTSPYVRHPRHLTHTLLYPHSILILDT
jgi:hypothetical protein